MGVTAGQTSQTALAFGVDGSAAMVTEAPDAHDGRADAQTALAFGVDGSAAMVTEAPDAHDGRRRGKRQPRFDVRRTAAGSCCYARAKWQGN